MYVELIEFKEGDFVRRHPPFFTKKAFAIFDQTVAKYNVPDKEIIVAIRNDNHSLVKAWGNVKEKPKYGIRLKAAKGK